MANKRRPQAPSGRQDTGQLLTDPANLTIIAALLDDPRVSMAELGRRAGLSPPAVTGRVQRLERAAVISG